MMADAIRVSSFALDGMPLNVRLIVERSEIERQPGVYDFAALDTRLERYGRLAGVKVYLDLRGGPTSPEAFADWGRFVRAVAARARGKAGGYLFGALPAGATTPVARDHAFFVKTTTINLRAGDDATATILVIGSGGADWLAALYAEDVAPYIDVMGLAPAIVAPAILAAIDQFDSTAGVVVLGEPLAEDPAAGAQRFLARHLAALGTRVSGVTYDAPVPVLAAALSVVNVLRGMLSQEVVTLDEKAVGFRLVRAGQDGAGSVSHKLLLGLGTVTNYLIYSGSPTNLELSLTEQSGAAPRIVDALRGTRTAARDFRYDADAHIARLELPATSGPLIVDWNTGEGATYSAREDVASTVLPSVAEIISRHQQVQAAQEGVLRSYVAQAKMEQHFRPTGIDSGFDVVTDNRLFVEGGSSEWEELSFSLNGTKWGAKRPAFPLLQAEKVLSLPFDLRLSTDYRYQLAGLEQVEGRACFALRFDPVDEERSLYRGTVWIDRETYVKVKAQTVQTRLVSPVLSSEEIHYFATAGTLESRDIRLLTRLVGRQIMLIAGRNLLVERGVEFSDFQLNPADFTAQREAARASDRVMYRDTDEGLRYLTKRDGARVVQEATTTATAALLGVTYDPSYDFPLPLAGINYLDFNFLGQDNQLAVVFGGVLALVNVQRAKLIGERIDGSLDLFAIAVKGNDRAYDSTGELVARRLNTRPFSTGINLGWQLAQFQKLLASYQFQFNAISKDANAALDFQIPVSTVTNGFGLAWEWKQGGYSFMAGATKYSRAHWEQWGVEGDYEPSDKNYLKYNASLTKDFFFGFHKVHLNTAYYGGRHLDRFSAYQFGFYDENRVHGVPSSGVRFGELAMFRGSYAFNIFEQHRLELFVDYAYGRDPRLTSGWEAVTGIGLGGNTRGPFNTLLRGDVGKSFLPTRYRAAGSLVVQFQVLKPL